MARMTGMPYLNWVLGLVTPGAHTNPRTDAATQQGQPQQRLLGDAPGVLLGLPFVEAVDEEGGDIERNKGVEQGLSHNVSMF